MSTVGKPKQAWILGATAIAAALSGLTFGAWHLAYATALDGLAHELGDDLTVIERAVHIEIERFDALPMVAREDLRVVALIEHRDPASVAEANAYLKSVRDRTGAAEIFIMDDQGLTLAASNWEEDGSFVGHNYSFRPYFRDALDEGQGFFYAVGITSGLPGYFISSRVETPSGRIGVVVAKLDLSPLERNWKGAGGHIAMADSTGVVFLSGQNDWKYRPLWPLSPEDFALLDAERKYVDVSIARAEPFFPQKSDLQSGQVMGSLYFQARQLASHDNWLVFEARPIAPVLAAANQAAVLTALAGALAAALLLYARQMNQLSELKSRQNAELEERVAERTRELALEVEERKRAEADLRETHEDLIQAAKLAALGKMSAAIAHEVSQPLAALEMTLSAAMTHAERGNLDMASSKLRSGRGLIRRMQSTIRHLRSFARKDTSKTTPVDATAAACGALELAEPRARAVGASIRSSFAPQDLVVMARAVLLEQVLLNLLLNALDAVDGRELRDISLEVGKRGELVYFKITDSGVGIPVEMEDKLPKPFFTTKQGDAGLGLGLAISSAIIEEFGGTIRFSGNPGGGTICEVCLAALDGASDLQAAQ